MGGVRVHGGSRLVQVLNWHPLQALQKKCYSADRLQEGAGLDELLTGSPGARWYGANSAALGPAEKEV